MSTNSNSIKATTAVNGNDFGSLFQAENVNIPKPDDVIKGTIISAERNAVHIDVAGITIGVVRGRELFAESNEYANLKVGDEAEATVLELENENGEMELSFRSAGYRRAWDKAKDYLQKELTIKAKVTAANRGGLIMQVEALQGFMPVSQLNPEHYPRVAGGDKSRILDKLRELMGQDLEVKVIDANENEEKLIVSERAVWEDSQKAVLESYKVGDTVEGEIGALTSFGAFMKFGEGLEGLIHISEIAWQRIDHPRDVLKIGDKVKAQIIQLDHSKIYLSIKRTVEDPWKQVKDRYSVGQTVSGKILKVESFGLMVGLDNEIHGLAHISELADDPMTNIHDNFKVGETKEFEIVSLEPAEHRLGLKIAGVKGRESKQAEDKAEQNKGELNTQPVLDEPPETKAEVVVKTASEEVNEENKSVD